MKITVCLAALCLAASMCFGVAITNQESAWAQISPRGTNNAAPNYNTSVIPPSASGQGINPPSGTPLAYMILLRFDLSSVGGPGLVFAGDVKIRWGMNWGENGPLPYRLYTVISNWTQSTVTWENFIGPGSTNNNPPYGNYPNNNQMFTNVLGEELCFEQVYGTGVIPEGTNVFTISPGSKLNYMLQDDSKNLGIALVPQWYANQMWWNHAGNWNDQVRSRIPVMWAEVVPEPVFLPLLAGLGFLAYRRMR